MGSPDEGLVKIFIDLAGESPGGESFWAKPLGGDRYELRNVPFHAYNLHFNDVVQAIPDLPNEKPRLIRVVQPSGHRTLRVFFHADVSEAQQLEMLQSLNQWRAYFERATNRLYALDVEPDGDYQAVCDQLWEWEQRSLLKYETGIQAETPSDSA